MKTTNETTSTPAKPRALKRQADRSLFSSGDSGLLLYFEDPALLAFVRNAALETIQPANDFERLFTELAVRSLWRAIRTGTLETAGIDVEMADHQETVESRWGKIDPASAYHLSTRDSSTRSAIREYAQVEAAAIRAFKDTAQILKSFRSH